MSHLFRPWWIAVVVFLNSGTWAQTGSQLNVYVGAPAGSGYDLPARAFARHVGKHLPGNPATVVRNMPGANGIILANYIKARGAKDGSDIAMVHNTIVMDAMLGNEAVKFRPDEFVWIGSVSPSTNVCVVWRTAQVQSFEMALEKDLRIGATSATDATTIVPRFLNAFIGTKFIVTMGYSGTPMLFNAIERGEVDGVCAAWDSLLKWRPAGVSSGDMKVLLQVGIGKDRSLPDVPLAMDLAKTPQDRETLQFLTARQAFARPLITSPGVDAEVTKRLREAFMATMNDPEFQSDAKRVGIPVEPIDGQTVEKLISRLMETSPEIVARAASASN